MLVLILQLAYFCSLCVSLPLPQTRDSTYPPFLVSTVFPICDGDCDNVPPYRVTTQFSVFARCDGDCPNFPAYRVVSDEDGAEASYTSTVIAASVTTSTPPLPSSTSTTTYSETTAPELSTTLATETTTTTPAPEPSSTTTESTATTVISTAYAETPLFAVDAAKTTGGSDE